MRKVYLVGSGPGDPDLITVKGLECLRKADVIIYDYLANEKLLQHARVDAELIYVGKRGNQHSLEQDEINRLIVDQAKAKEEGVVVRLKGGDPFVFGRGGEEAIFMKEHGVPFEIVPGITAGIAAPAYAGIPVTHRGYTSTFGMLTGHEDPNKPESSIDWEKVAKSMGTLVFYMGVKTLPKVVEQLIKHGRSKDTPVAVIQWGTKPEQQTVVGNLENIVERSKSISPPAITIVGKVVELREQISWFESKPLFGKKIVVTRSRTQASKFAKQLSELGADVLEFPTIKITDPDDYSPLDKVLDTISGNSDDHPASSLFDWLIFTSVNGVERFFNRLFSRGGDIRDLKGVKLCAIGPATAEAIKSYHLHIDCQPKENVAESIVEAFRKFAPLEGKKILLPRAEVARSLLPDELREMGAEVTEVTVYKTVIENASPRSKEIADMIISGDTDVVAFTSSSTVKNFVQIIGRSNIERFPNRVRFATIGPVTTQAAKSEGIKISIEAKDYSIPGLVEAIVGAMKRKTY